MSHDDDMSPMNPKTIVKWGCYVACGIAALFVLLVAVTFLGLMLSGHPH